MTHGEASTGRPSAPAERSPGLEIYLFGPVEVRVGGRPLPRLRSRKGFWLLGLLALRSGREVDRDWLAGTLWPEADEAGARRSLRQSLHDLRLCLGPEGGRLAGEGVRTLRLEQAGAFVDVLAFDAALARAEGAEKTTAREEAVRLYRGPLLEDCAEEWVLPARRQREQAYLGALQALAAEATARRDFAAAVSYLQQAAAVDPYWEECQRSLMEALAAAGSPGEALLVYRRFRELLWREMNAEPAEETTALFRRLLEESRARAQGGRGAEGQGRDSVPPSSRAPLLPLPLTELIGREAAVREVSERLTRARLVTLTGTGGIGKTRLALQVAQEVAEEFPDGSGFVNLAPLADPDRVTEAVRAALELPPGAAAPEALEVVRGYLSSRQLLLVLDNCEHLLKGCAALAEELLSHCAGLRILATSRQPLGPRGELVWRVPPLELTVDSSQLTVEEGPVSQLSTVNCQRSTLPAAVRLFVERARAVEGAFEWTPGNAAAVARVCRRLDGIPLAIELAAARVRAMPVEQLARRLEESFRLLSGGGPGLLPRHETLAATFDWSWELLTEPERTLLLRLAVFAGGWTLEAAEAVCSADPEGSKQKTEGSKAGSLLPSAFCLLPSDILDLLTSLVDKSLVVYRAEGGEGRYTFLEPVRQYAAERLRGSAEGDATADRHRDYFLEWAEEVKPKLFREDQGSWFRRVEGEHDNLRAALEWCRARREAEKELRLAVALSRFWDTHGHLREGRAHLEEALSRMTDAMPARLRAHAQIHAGWMAYVVRDFSAARGHYGAALDLCPEPGDRAVRSQVFNMLAVVAMAEGSFDEARSLLGECLAGYRERGIPEPAGIYDNLGALALRQKEYEEARYYVERSVARWGKHRPNQEGHALALLNLSLVDYRQGRHREALEHGAASLRILHAGGLVVHLPGALDRLAVLAGTEGEWGRAVRLLAAAEQLREAAGGQDSESAVRERAEDLAKAERALGADAFAAAAAEGRAMDLEQAVAYALDDLHLPEESCNAF
jgi:predicted ATPase/DNA-binding SARP family transcriptional activator